MRLFVAIEIPENVKSKIFHQSEILQKKNLFKGRFVRKDDLHLTLEFIGDVSEEEAEEIKNKLKKIKFDKFEAEIGEAGAFDSEDYIKVIWVDLLSGKIKELQKQISSKLLKIPAERGFNSHITLARVKSVNNKQDLIKSIRDIHLKKLKFKVNEFLLMKSELTREGPKYKTVEMFKLS